MNKIKIASIEDIPSEHWDAYVNEHPDGTIYHGTLWRDIISDVFGHRCHYLVAQNDSGALIGVLPLIHLKSPMFGSFMVSLPYVNYGGVLSDGVDVDNALLAKAVEIGRQVGVSHVEFRELSPLNCEFPSRTDKVLMYLDLPKNEDDLWSSIGAKSRAQIKRADREGVSISRGKLECLDGFYEVFSRNMRDLGTPVYSKKFFHEILIRIEEATIVLVHVQGRLAAAAFTIGHRGRMEIPWASSVRDFNRYGVNMRLYWEVMKFTIERGYSVFDFGRSSIDSGTFKFKKQWGAKPIQCYWYYWLRDAGSIPQLNHSNKKLKLLIDCWKMLPVSVTQAFGPHIVKYLP